MINTFRFYQIDLRFQQNDSKFKQDYSKFKQNNSKFKQNNLKKLKDFSSSFFAFEYFNDAFLMDY